MWRVFFDSLQNIEINFVHNVILLTICCYYYYKPAKYSSQFDKFCLVFHSHFFPSIVKEISNNVQNSSNATIAPAPPQPHLPGLLLPLEHKSVLPIYKYISVLSFRSWLNPAVQRFADMKVKISSSLFQVYRYFIVSPDGFSFAFLCKKYFQRCLTKKNSLIS